MYQVLFVLLLAYLASDYFPKVKAKDALTEHWLRDVPLDHFNLFDDRTWDMRYYVNKKYFKPGNPLFIEVSGEWTMNGAQITGGQIHILAKKHQGLLIETEHRYYGQSLPFKNFTTENLKYLQIEQALEDVAYFIEHFKSTYPGANNSKVILHGCSYPGMLVTWMRLRFPHIVDISYASSAPLGVGLDYPEYYEIVSDTYANVSVSCIETIREGFNRTAKLLKTKQGRRIVKKALKDWDCGEIKDLTSVEILQTMMSVLNVQMDPIQFEDVVCLALSIDTDDKSSFERLAEVIVLKSKSLNVCDSNDGEEDEESTRTKIAWTYQTCTEMGTFQTLSRKNSRHPFELDSTIEESVEQCVSLFGGIVTEEVLRNGIERVTRRYGGKRPLVTKVVTVQGTHDPWKHLASLEDYTPDAPVYLAEGSHCVDIDTAGANDPQQVKDIRVKVRDLISKWIEEISNL